MTRTTSLLSGLLAAFVVVATASALLWQGDGAPIIVPALHDGTFAPVTAATFLLICAAGLALAVVFLRAVRATPPTTTA